MVFRRRNTGKIQIKHVVDTQDVIPAGTAVDKLLVSATDNPLRTNANEVTNGSHVSSMFLNIQVINSLDSVGSINNCYMYAFLNPSGLITPINFPLVNAVGASKVRNKIFHQDMVMLGDQADGIPLTLFKGVLKIPKKAQRMGIDDEISIRIGTPVGGAEVEACVQCIYKEYK